MDLFVTGLTEVLIPEAHSAERLRCHGADDFVDLAAERLARVAGRDRYRDDDSGRAGRLEGLDRGLHRGTGRETVVHQDDRPTRQIGFGSFAPVQPLAPV